jgi:hypothetical protein
MPISPVHELELKMCFLYGVREEQGDFNMLHNSKTIGTMVKRCEKLGLSSPRNILLSSMEKSMTALFEYEKKQEQV